MSYNKKKLSLKGFLASTHELIGTYIVLWKAAPVLIYDFCLLIFKSILSVFTYHIFTLPAKPLHNEVAMIIGSDSHIGRAFSTQVAKMNGTVVCVDENKDRGETFVKGINDIAGEQRAHFYECDVKKPESLSNVIEAISKDIGDISILVNCSRHNLIANYYNVYRPVLSLMKVNKKGHLVFLRAFDTETRDAVQVLYEGVNRDLRASKADKVSTTIAHVYPMINEDGARNIFGSIKPDFLAAEVLEGVSRNYRELYLPEYMVYFNIWLRFLPSGLTNLMESFLFGDKK